jgi:hypothetical protein
MMPRFNIIPIGDMMYCWVDVAVLSRRKERAGFVILSMEGERVGLFVLFVYLEREE